MRVEIADLVECPEGMEMFLYLADRTALLFPEGGRVIFKVATEPAHCMAMSRCELRRRCECITVASTTALGEEF